MAEIILLDNDQITLKVYPESHMIHHEMHKYTHDETFREAMMVGVDAMKKYRATKWLSDDRSNPVRNPGDQEWTVKIWRPEVLKAGWKYWAIVQPEAVVAKLRMEKSAKDLSELGVTVKIFTDPQEARRWLEQQG
jgi:hypothetical protein